MTTTAAPTTRYLVRLTDEGWQIHDTDTDVFLADSFGEWWIALEEGDRLNRAAGLPIEGSRRVAA